MPERKKYNGNEAAGKRKFSRRDFLAAGGVAAAAPVLITTATSSTAAAAQNTAGRFDAAVNFVTERGLMDGSGASFNPDANVDRATAVTALYRLAGSPPVTYEPVFADVPVGRRYSDAVVWANETGIIAGFIDGRFNPDDAITRQQFAAMIFRYADIKNPQVSDLEGFTDKDDIREFAEKGMGWCIAKGLITGTAGAALAPNGNLTRGWCAEILQSFVNLREDRGNIWVLNPRPTLPPVETTGLAPRVTGGWAGKTVVAMSNYNGHVSKPFGAAIEARIKTTLSAGETVRLIYIGDLTVIRYQTTNPSGAPNANWEEMGYEAFLAEVEKGALKPDAIIVGGGF